MLSLDLIRRKQDMVQQALARRGEDAEAVLQAAELDARRRTLVTERDSLRGQHNELSRRFGALRREGGEDALADLRRDIAAVAERTARLEEEAAQVEGQLQELLLGLPNLPLPQVPDGLDESANTIVREWGERPTPSFEPQPHWDLGERLGILDLERGARLSGSRFFVLMGAGARLERALVNWMLDIHTRESGYVEVQPPALVREEVLVGSGNLPKFGDNLYRDAEEDLWLIPTAEVPLTSLHRSEILAPGALPINYVASTPCFRREKAAAGQGHPRHQARAPVPEGGDVLFRGAGALRGGPGATWSPMRRVALPKAGPALPRAAALRRRSGLPLRHDLRHRGMGAGVR